MMNRRNFLKQAGIGLAALAAARPGVSQTPKRPNVILIMADDLGAEGLACYGGTSYKTPLLDKMAANGMQFTHCYSQPLCTPSRVKIMTGRSNARNYKSFGHLDPKEITFGHVMKKAGYNTCIAGKWQLCGGNDHNGTFPKEAGFDEHCMWAYHHDLPGDAKEKYTFFGKKVKKTSRFWNPAILKNGNYVPTTTDDYGPDIYCDFILDFISKNREEPFFVYYPMALTHNPFVCTPHSKDQSERAKTKSNNRFFEDMIQYTGHNVNRIIEAVEKLDLAENTLVLFTADNGTYKGIFSRMGDRPVPGGKSLPIDAGVHVALLAWWQDTIQPGSICTDLVDFSDFMPTLAEAGAAKLPDDRILDGKSFLPQLKGATEKRRDTVLVHYDKNPDDEKPQMRRVRFAYDGKYKLYLDGRFLDVPNDWTEEHPIAPEKMTPAQQAARKCLAEALATLPDWEPDNSAFDPYTDPGLEAYRKKATRMAR